jgi:hypothetical protein
MTTLTGRHRRGWDKERHTKEGKKEVKSRRRSSPYTTESTMIDRIQKLEEVSIDDEVKESMDETISGI